MNFLGNLQLPQFAPGQLVEGMGGLDQSLARNAQLGQQQQQRPKKPFAESTFGRILGALGDALLVNSGRAPMYAPMAAQRREEQRQNQANEAIGNYLGNLDPGLRDLIMQAGPGAAMQAYGLAHPKSDNEPAFVRELQAFGFSPDEQKQIARRRYTRPIIVGNAETGYGVLEDGEGGDAPPAAGEVTATGPNGEKIRLNPSTGQWEPVGGPTAGPSGGFQ